jgi:hypothetical protein
MLVDRSKISISKLVRLDVCTINIMQDKKAKYISKHSKNAGINHPSTSSNSPIANSSHHIV